MDIQFLCLNPQYFRKYRVESSHPDIFSFRTHYLGNTLTHFFGRLIGKSKYQDIERIDTVFDQVSHPASNYPRLYLNPHRPRSSLALLSVSLPPAVKDLIPVNNSKSAPFFGC